MSLFNRPKHIVRGNWSGVLIRGEKKLEVPLLSSTDHWKRAAILTAFVETGGVFGTVMNYDGTGMTASVTQCVAILPRSLMDSDPSNDQGELWEIVEEIRNAYPEITKRLDGEFKELLWTIKNGQVRFTDSGRLVPGSVLREELSPPQGKVPSSGSDWQSAKGWALIFNEIFSDERTFPIQLDFAVRKFKEFSLQKRPQLNGKSVQEVVYSAPGMAAETLRYNMPMDLAMAAFLSYSVNAPAQALRILSAACCEYERVHLTDMSKTLLRIFRNSTYANWEERYKRTRSSAQKIWPPIFFKGPEAIML